MGRHCPYCNQILPEYRLDVQLTPFQARIFDLVCRAGRDGIAWDDLFALTYNGFDYAATKGKAKHKQTRKALKSSIYRVNEAIEDSGYRIIGRGLGPGIYRLEQLLPVSRVTQEAAE